MNFFIELEWLCQRTHDMGITGGPLMFHPEDWHHYVYPEMIRRYQMLGVTEFPDIAPEEWQIFHHFVKLDERVPRGEFWYCVRSIPFRCYYPMAAQA